MMAFDFSSACRLAASCIFFYRRRNAHASGVASRVSLSKPPVADGSSGQLDTPLGVSDAAAPIPLAVQER
jgi:hypothetical protein